MPRFVFGSQPSVILGGARNLAVSNARRLGGPRGAQMKIEEEHVPGNYTLAGAIGQPLREMHSSLAASAHNDDSPLLLHRSRHYVIFAGDDLLEQVEGPPEFSGLGA